MGIFSTTSFNLNLEKNSGDYLICTLSEKKMHWKGPYRLSCCHYVKIFKKHIEIQVCDKNITEIWFWVLWKKNCQVK